MEFINQIKQPNHITEAELQEDYEVLCNIAEVKAEAMASMNLYIETLNQGVTSAKAFHVAANYLDETLTSYHDEEEMDFGYDPEEDDDRADCYWCEDTGEIEGTDGDDVVCPHCNTFNDHFTALKQSLIRHGDAKGVVLCSLRTGA